MILNWPAVNRMGGRRPDEPPGARGAPRFRGRVFARLATGSFDRLRAGVRGGFPPLEREAVQRRASGRPAGSSATPAGLRRDRNLSRHIRMKAAEVINLARVGQRNASHPLRRYGDIPVLVSSRRRVDDEIAARPFDRVADMRRNPGRIEGHLVDRDADRFARELRETRPRSYFRDWATCSACISWPWNILRPVLRRSFNSGFVASGMRTVSSAPSTVL